MKSNRGKILSLIRERGEIHQTELARILDVEKSTVSRIVKKLSDDGLLITAGELPAGKTGGRKSVLLKLDPNGLYAIAVDFDVQTTVIAVVDQTGRIGAVKTLRTPDDTTPDSILSFLSEQIALFLKRKNVKSMNIIGVGIASCGVIDPATGTVISTFCFNGWDHVPMAENLSVKLGLPVFVDNNVRLEAVGESCFGLCRGIDDFLCVSVRYGIGLGIFSNGRLFRGAHNQAGDMHLSLDDDGPMCVCGRKGCIEALAGTKVVLEKLANTEIKTLDDLVEAMKEPDEILKSLADASGHHIGRLVAHLTELFDPEKVVFGGPLIHSGDYLRHAIQKSFQTHVHKDRWVVENLEPSTLGNNAALAGAAALAMDSLFECGFQCR